MGSHGILRRGIATSGGAAAVTVAVWCGEQAATRSTARVGGSLAMQCTTATPRCHLLSKQQPQSKFFSTTTTAVKPAAEAATIVPPPPPAAAKASSSSSSPSFVQWYEGHLEAHPILTKSVTGSILWGIGDCVAQLVPQLSFSEEGGDRKEGMTYDWMRTGRAVTFGGIIHAPTSHVHFNFLEWMTNKAGVTGLAIPVFKTIMEQFVYWSWISNSMYHGAMGAMQGMTPTQIYDRIADVLMDTQKAQWAFWIPVQLLNFKFVPVRHQLNVVLVTSIVWTALLSMWYPPVVDKVTMEEEVVQDDATKK